MSLVRRHGSESLLCVGLDPDPTRIDGGAQGAYEHCLTVVEKTADLACCFKPSAALWEQYGPAGWDALSRLRERIPGGIPVLFDAKRACLPRHEPCSAP